jgi:hypothetical protein
MALSLRTVGHNLLMAVGISLIVGDRSRRFLDQ